MFFVSLKLGCAKKSESSVDAAPQFRHRQFRSSNFQSFALQKNRDICAETARLRRRHLDPLLHAQHRGRQPNEVRPFMIPGGGGYWVA